MFQKKTLWISHSAISSYSKCPHLYYLEYEYRNPKTGNRIQITNPYLALGLSVHETIEGLLDVSLKERTKVSLKERFDKIFNEYRGLKGGFLCDKKENSFYKRGVMMIERVEKSSFLLKPSKSLENSFPTVNLLENDKDSQIEAKLVGSVDWIEILPNKKAHIIDFKTGNSRESNGSLQLPIYTILAENNLKEEVEKTSYWYLEHDSAPAEHKVGDINYWKNIIEEKAAIIKSAVKRKEFYCNYPGRCFSCGDYEKIFKGEAEKVDLKNTKNKDVFCIFKEKDVIDKVMAGDFLDEREKKIFELRMKKEMKEINKELRLSDKKSEEIVHEIKRKLKKGLRKKELNVVIRLLGKKY